MVLDQSLKINHVITKLFNNKWTTVTKAWEALLQAVWDRCPVTGIIIPVSEMRKQRMEGIHDLFTVI